MAGLHPTELGALFQEGRPESESNSPSSSATAVGCEAVPVPLQAGLSRKPPDYVISDRQMRRLFWQYEQLGKRLRIVHELSYRQPHCPHGGEIRAFYLAPQQLKLEAACLHEHGAANVDELLERCVDLLASRLHGEERARLADPVFELALATLRDAHRLCAQMRRLPPEDSNAS